MIRSLLKSLVVLAVFIPLAAFLPLASVALSRTPDGAVILFFAAPWSCCLYVLVYSQLSLVPWRRGAQAVRDWREEHGGLLHTSILATCWMFGALFFSYVAEALLIWFTRSPAWLPAGAYSPLLFCWLWRHTWAR